MSEQALTLKKTLLGIAVLLIIGYGVFTSRFLIQGPEITISNESNEDGAIISAQKTLFLQGKVSHSSFISINGRPIFIDETGQFNEKLLLSNSMSIIDIYAKDKFGKEVRKKIDVVYQGESVDTDYSKVATRTKQMTGSSTPSDSSSFSSSTQPTTQSPTPETSTTTEATEVQTTVLSTPYSTQEDQSDTRPES